MIIIIISVLLGVIIGNACKSLVFGLVLSVVLAFFQIIKNSEHNKQKRSDDEQVHGSTVGNFCKIHFASLFFKIFQKLLIAISINL